MIKYLDRIAHMFEFERISFKHIITQLHRYNITLAKRKSK